MATIFPLKHKWNEVGKKKECYCSVKALDLHCNSIEFVGQKHCFLLTTAVCLKNTYLATRFQPLFYYIKTRCIFLLRPSSLFNQKERMSFLPIIYMRQRRWSFKRECARSCVIGHCLLGFYIMYKIEIEGVFLVFFVMFSTLFFPLLIIRKEGIGMLGHIVYLGKYQLIGKI